MSATSASRTRQAPLTGRSPANKGRRYPPDPPHVEETIAVMRHAGSGPHAERLRALIVIMWRSGLRISEALALAESDLDLDRGAVVVRHGKGNKRREVGMDEWGWQQLVDASASGALFRPRAGAARAGR